MTTLCAVPASFSVPLMKGAIPLRSARVLVAVGFLMLLLTSLQGWGMVGIIAFLGEEQSALLQELRRLHNLGLSGGFLAISFGLTMILLPLGKAPAGMFVAKSRLTIGVDGHSKTFTEFLMTAWLPGVNIG